MPSASSKIGAGGALSPAPDGAELGAETDVLAACGAMGGDELVPLGASRPERLPTELTAVGETTAALGASAS